MKRAFAAARFNAPLHSVEGGASAIAYLNGEGLFGDRLKHPLPSVILLDLKMPTIDGFQVLQQIKAHPVWRSICVIVLTSSSLPSDIKRAYLEEANAYLVKPSSMAGLIGMVCCLRDWLDYNQLPQPMENGPAEDLENPQPQFRSR